MSFKKVYDKNPVGLKGDWTKVLTGPDGEVKGVWKNENVVVTGGKSFLADFLYSAALAAATFTMKYMAIGTDATTEAVGNTALGTELARHTGTVATSAPVYRVTATFGAGLGTGAIVEYGIFSSSTGGTLLCRDTESVINKGAGDTLTVTAEITIS